MYPCSSTLAPRRVFVRAIGDCPAPRARQSSDLGLFSSRCYAEGISKAQIAQYVGASDALSSEQTYTLRTLPSGVWHALLDTVRGRSNGLGRASAIVVGFLWTVAGYLRGKWAKPASNSGAAIQEPTASHFKPAEMCEIELSQPIAALLAHEGELTYQRVLALVRLHGQALGMIEFKLPPDGLDGDEVAAQIWRKFEGEIGEHLRTDGLAQVGALTALGLNSVGSRPLSTGVSGYAG